MSNHLNHLEYVQLTKLYDECLSYLKEQHENLQTITETEEPDYESIKDSPTGDNQIEKDTDKTITHNGEHFEIQNISDDENSQRITDVQNTNNTHNETETGIKFKSTEDEDKSSSENIDQSLILYETFDHEVKHSIIETNDGCTEINRELNSNKYYEAENVLYETVNQEAKFDNYSLKKCDSNNSHNDVKLQNDVGVDTKKSSENSSYGEDEQDNTVINECNGSVEINVVHDTNNLKAITFQEGNKHVFEKPTFFKLENELKSTESLSSVKSERLRKLSQQLPKIIITTSSTSLNMPKIDRMKESKLVITKSRVDKLPVYNITRTPPTPRTRKAYGEFPKRLVSKSGLENVALISNVPFEKIRLLNDTFHTLINLRWRWIVIGTIVVHFLIWLVFAVFWYITALAHYDFEPDPPKRTCVTGGKDFVTIFLASVEAQTTIGFGDRTIDEECPESIFLFIMQLILGTGLSGVLTCVVYAKLTRPEKLSRDGVGFSKKALISMRDGRLCLMIRAWDLNYDHIISSEFTAHFINTRKTKEGEIIRYYAQTLALQQRQFLLWPVTLVHVIDNTSPLYKFGPDVINHSSFEITVSLKGASASMGTFTQSQTSYVPKEILWGHRFPPVVKYDCRKQKYVIDYKKLNITEPVDTPHCSAEELNRSIQHNPKAHAPVPSTPSSFGDKMSVFRLERQSSFRKKKQ